MYFLKNLSLDFCNLKKKKWIINTVQFISPIPNEEDLIFGIRYCFFILVKIYLMKNLTIGLCLLFSVSFIVSCGNKKDDDPAPVTNNNNNNTSPTPAPKPTCEPADNQIKIQDHTLKFPAMTGEVTGGAWFVYNASSITDSCLLTIAFYGTKVPKDGLYSLEASIGYPEIANAATLRMGLRFDEGYDFAGFNSAGKLYVNTVNGKKQFTICNSEFQGMALSSVDNTFTETLSARFNAQ